MGLVSTPFSGKQEVPRPPPDIADEVEMYARQSGRHATLRFCPHDLLHPRKGGTWRIQFTLRLDDKRMILYQESRTGKPPTEDVWLHVKDPESPTGYRPLDLEQMGSSGVKEFLERGNTWSGRGEFDSLEAQAREAMEANAKMREKNRESQKEASRNQASDTRRRRLKIPFLPIGIDLRSKKSEV